MQQFSTLSKSGQKGMSLGRDWFSGMRFFFSTTGEKFADEQADTILVLNRSCLTIASPRP